MNTSRFRRFELAWPGAALLCLCALPPRGVEAQHAREFRVGVAWPADPELRRGIAFGIAEAQRSLALFRWTLEVDSILGREVPAGIDALITADSVRIPEGLPVLLLRCVRLDSALIVAACADTLQEWHPALERYGAAQVNDRYRAATGTGMSAAAWKGWFALKILSETALRARTTEPAAIAARLRAPGTVFDGHKGMPLRFDSAGVLLQPLYRMSPDGSVTEIRPEDPTQ